ncbi:peptidase A4 family-domain-containing protein [Lasiosphaeris hirsuta]|uniref:Peptidase A4 family-domain-containing protein n=1 Tax=Lasiosphaeris hirsuta TaxID=260670 RepID=A0AA40B9K7_9PEZI|nr:peptidase A4 family-domain-containing protein [Lasiosphaeris hirsuta]
MWSFVCEFLVASLVAWSAAAELSFVAEGSQRGKKVDIKELDFQAIPPRRHWQEGSRSRSHPHVKDASKRADISYSGNWCGASQHSTSADQIVNAFSYFTAPDLQLRPGIPGAQYAAAWVGIDGAACKSALLQAGVTTVVNTNGGQSASAWWQWYPEASYSIKGLPVKPGEWMTVNITATSATSGKVIITNAQQGYSVAITVSNGPKLCRVDAEWIVEDFYDAKGQVAFASFSDVWFVDAAATTVKGKNIGIDGAAMVHLQNENGTVVCEAEAYDNSNFVLTSK